jgi:C-methyltransferase C-terminal domain/Putative zinc binding domain/Methyltransferase domain
MSCLVCRSADVVERIDVGSHPVASRFLDERDAPETGHRLALGQCGHCGTIQMMRPVDHEALIPPVFIPAREPEEHLDQVVEQIVALPGVTTDSVIGALTYKDDTTVDRFMRKGFTKTWRVDLSADLGITHPAANIETVQKRTEPSRMAAIAARRGAADVLIVRHITEHAEDPNAFVAGLAAMVKPGGIIMVEVPDCSTNLELGDYCMVWEEHALYLTPATFEQLLSIGGFETISSEVHPRPFENSLVYLGRKLREPAAVAIAPAARAEAGWLADYAARYEPAKRELRSLLERVRRERGPIALFGAGHLAHAFANFMDVADLIDFVADDTPEKQGRFLPGARLPIVPSAALVERKIALCLLALSINNEGAVMKRNQAFIDAGGEFRSIFRASTISIFPGKD